MVLSSHTGWGIDEMLSLPFQTFLEFIELLPRGDHVGNSKP